MIAWNERCRTASKIAPVLPAFLVLSCSEGVNENSDRHDAATWTVTAEPIVTIGQVEGDPEYLFSRVGPAALLPDGAVAVADLTEAAIRLFTKDGVFDREIGRRGEGPGEFSNIRTMAVSAPDTIMVHDSRLLRLSRFLTSGQLLSSVQVQAEDGWPEVYLGEFSNGELGFAWIRIGPRDEHKVTPDEMQIARFSAAGRMNALIGTETGILRAGSTVLAFSPYLYAEMIGDSILLTNGLRPEIEVWDRDGNLTRVISIPVAEVDASLAWAELEEEVRARGGRRELERFENQPRDVTIPPISMMLVDDRDRIWVKKYDPRTDSFLLGARCTGGEWLILDGNGTVVATIQLPDGFLLLDVRGGRLLGKVRDELGVERIQVYGIAD